MKDVNNQMENINNTIGTTLSSQLLSNKSNNNNNERCQTCIATTASLAELQQQVQIAMKRVEKMNASLSALQTHSNLVQQSLATISSHALLNSSGSSPVMNGTHLSPPPEIVSTAPSSAPSNLVTPAAAADHQGGAKSLAQSSTINVEDHKSTLAQRQEQILKRGTKILESNKWGSTPPIGSTAQEEKPKSFRELMMEKRKKTNDSSKKQSATAVSNVEGGDATRKEKKIVTLGDLITSCAPYLTGSSSEYADWLREELDISTISDLAEAVEECPELLIAGNGTVGMWQKHKFSDAVKKAAASCSSTTTSKPSSSSAAVTKEDDSFKSCQSSEGGKMAMLQQRIASRKAAAQSSTTMGKSIGSMTGGDWTCSVCTCINPKLYLSCSACGSANSSDAKEDGKSITPPGTSAATNTAATSQFSFNTPNSAAHVLRAKQEKEYEEKKRKEANAKTQRKKVKQKEELARKQEEEERAAAMAEKQRRIEAKREKQEAMARHENEVQKQQSSKTSQPIAPTPSSSSSTKLRPPVVHTAPSTSSRVVSPSKHDTKSESNTRQVSAITTTKKPVTQTITRTKKVVPVDRLSYYIKPLSRSKVGKKVSPIFELLQNESTVDVGRKLLMLEGQTGKCRDELAETLALRFRLERGIKAEKNFVKRCKRQIAEAEKKTQKRWNIFGLSKNKEEDIHKELVNL